MRTLTLALLLGFGTAAAQDAPKKEHNSTDPWKCKTCGPALQKAYAYLDKNGNGADGYRQIFMGFVWIADGNKPDDLKKAVNAVQNSFYKQKSFNENWATCMAAIFLSEVYKRQPTEKLRTALLDILKVAAERIESTGGWCHHLGFAAESGYNKQGGGVDLGILTCMMFGAMLNMKKCGIEVDEVLFKKVQDNLESLSDGQGVGYGTDNKWGDIAMGRASWAWLGLHYSGYTGTKLAKGIPQGLKSRYKDTHKGHAYPPLHFESVAMAMHLQGPEMYNKFAVHWIDQLIALQKEDGSIELPHSEGKTLQKEDKFVASTAAFALILLLQQPGQLEKTLPKAKKEGGATASGGIFAKQEGKPFMGLRGNTFAGSLEVLKVTEKSPSETGGLVAGDLIIEFKGKKIEKTADLRAELDKCTPGQKVGLVVLRGGERKKIELKLGALEPPKTKDEDDVETPRSKEDEPVEEGELF